jgi:probable HAF family extracellular repeat protein
MAASAAAASYTITEIQTLENYPVGLSGLTERGAVAGTLSNDDDDSIAFLWTNGSIQEIGTLSLTQGYFDIFGINRREEVVGDFNGTNARAFLWQAGTVQFFGTLGGSHAVAYGINDHGDIVGASTLAGDNTWHPFLFRKGTMVDLGVFGGRDAFALALNNKRQVVIEHQDATGNRLAIYDDGDFRIIGKIGGWTTGQAINEAGHVVGECEGVVEPGQHAFYYDGQRLIDLHVAGETFSGSRSINNRDEIVGSWGIQRGIDYRYGGFLYHGGPRTEISELLPAGSGWSILTADYINDAGQIVGIGMRNGVRKFYLLTPMKR